MSNPTPIVIFDEEEAINLTSEEMADLIRDIGQRIVDSDAAGDGEVTVEIPLGTPGA